MTLLDKRILKLERINGNGANGGRGDRLLECIKEWTKDSPPCTLSNEELRAKYEPHFIALTGRKPRYIDDETPW